jgi:hypothetical protein
MSEIQRLKASFHLNVTVNFPTVYHSEGRESRKEIKNEVVETGWMG